MTILVTGGAGYIGSHTVRALTSAGRRVVVLDTLELGRADAVIDAELVVGDVADEGLVESACRDHDVTAIVHFAAYKNVGESMREPGKYWHNNVDGTVHLVEAARRAGVGQLVFSSSCSVNGTPPSVPVTEDQPIHPESVYAETKAMVERILGWYDTTHGLCSVSLRYFNAAGASSDGRLGEDWAYSQNLIPLAMRSLLLGAPMLQVYGADYDTPDGTCIRDYIHVEDLADAHVKALDYLAAGGATTSLNVGTGVGSSVFEVLGAIERVAGRPVPHEVVERRAGDPVATFADPTRSADVLGWRATHGLDRIVETAHRWHSSQLPAPGHRAGAGH
jgi:UDP-glucose 4-epimerase